MSEFFLSSGYQGLVMTLVFFYLGKAINRKAGRELINPLLLATLLCMLAMVVLDMDYDTYYLSARHLDALLTPTTICLAIPLYRQYQLLKKNAAAVLAGITAGILAHMAGCVAMLLLFSMERGNFISLLPKSITAAIGKSLSGELGGSPAITMALIMVTGLFGAVIAPWVMRIARIREPLA